MSVELPLFAAALPFELESGIPVSSDRSSSRNGSIVKPDLDPMFEAMRVGDSFSIYPRDCGDATLIQTQNIVTTAMCRFAKQYAADCRPKFTTRQQGGRFVRCWRIR